MNFTLQEKYKMLSDYVKKWSEPPPKNKVLPENGFKLYNFYVERRKLVKNGFSQEYTILTNMHSSIGQDLDAYIHGKLTYDKMREREIK
jgi:hypothetical protein